MLTTLCFELGWSLAGAAALSLLMVCHNAFVGALRLEDRWVGFVVNMAHPGADTNHALGALRYATNMMHMVILARLFGGTKRCLDPMRRGAACGRQSKAALIFAKRCCCLLTSIYVMATRVF